MPALKCYHIFVSHAWRYGEQYDQLIRMLDNAPNFKYANYSAPAEKPLQNLNATDVTTRSQIRAAIQRKIAPCSCVLVISGMYAAYREWMQYEIDTAVAMGKPIIAIRPWGAERMPEAVQSVAKKIVGWNAQSIAYAIRDCSQ